MSDIPDELRRPLLDAANPHIPFDGWTMKALEAGAEDLGIDKGMVKLIFPAGPQDAIDYLAASSDADMILHASNLKLDEMRLNEKITALVKLRIQAEEPYREAAQKAVSWLAMPQNQPLGLKMLYRTVDLMWKTTHDPSTDYNFYTKRLTLSAVYSSTFLYWLNDSSEDYADTWAFLDRRIGNILQFEKNKAKFLNKFDKFPNIWEKFGQMRYPQSHP